jgi:hypothetical protein
MHALREGHTSVGSESTQEDWEAHLGVGVRADPTNREGVHLKMGDIYAELIQVGGGGDAYSKRGQTAGSDCREEPTNEESALRGETVRGYALHPLFSWVGGVPPLFVCHHFSWARFCTPTTPKSKERDIPQERQKFERKERKEMSRHNRNKNEGGNKQEDIWRWVTSPFSRIANLASIYVENPSLTLSKAVGI